MKTKIIIFIAMLSASALCGVAQNNNALVFESRTSKPYHYINIKGEMNVKIVQDETPGVTVAGSKFQIDNTVSMLRNDTLFVYEANTRKKDSKVFVTINVKNISLLEVNGKTNVECDGLINTDFLTIRTYNGARIKLDVRALHVESKATGGSSIDLSGYVGSINECKDRCSVIDSNRLAAWEFNYSLINCCV